MHGVMVQRLAWRAYEADNARANAEYARLTAPTRNGIGERSGETGLCKCGATFEHNMLGRRRKFCRACSPPKEPK